VEKTGRKARSRKDMKSIKFKQFALSLAALLSLFVSGVSACACSHHQIQDETKSSSCHEHSPHQKAAQDQKNNLDGKIKSLVSEAECTCFQSASKFVTKSEINKFGKHIAAISLEVPAKIVSVPQTIGDQIRFSKPLYLSDSFYNISPGRAPPSL